MEGINSPEDCCEVASVSIIFPPVLTLSHTRKGRSLRAMGCVVLSKSSHVTVGSKQHIGLNLCIVLHLEPCAEILLYKGKTDGNVNSTLQVVLKMHTFTVQRLLWLCVFNQQTPLPLVTGDYNHTECIKFDPIKSFESFRPSCPT